MGGLGVVAKSARLGLAPLSNISLFGHNIQRPLFLRHCLTGRCCCCTSAAGLSYAVRFDRVWCRSCCAGVETRLLTWRDSGLVLFVTPGKHHQSARRQQSTESRNIQCDSPNLHGQVQWSYGQLICAGLSVHDSKVCGGLIFRSSFHHGIRFY